MRITTDKAEAIQIKNRTQAKLVLINLHANNDFDFIIVRVEGGHYRSGCVIQIRTKGIDARIGWVESTEFVYNGLAS